MGSELADRPAWVAVDLDAAARNLHRLRDLAAPSRVMGVIKADAYGHGAVETATRLAAEGADWFGVAFLEEAGRLRAAGVGTPVLVLGPTLPGEPGGYVELGITPTISGLDQLELWRGWAEAHGVVQPVHLKVDTGMSRLGIPMDALTGALDAIRESPALALEGLLSHLADADEPSSSRNEEQIALFGSCVEALNGEERESVLVHLANSGGALYQPPARHRMVRLGISLFGVDPARRETDLEPVMSVGARVVAVREVAAGTHVGYGSSWRAKEATRLAVVPVGYGDGYPWRLSNVGSILIGGRRYPLAGRVSMDMSVVELADANVQVGDEAVLLGRQGSASIGAWDLADQAGTTAWEILCRFGLRLPRRYLPRPTAG